ncbi:MFS general substrate transporter [Colletotrichum zoysiae]|uniref:MFS general substrate transporter n=1 Tax=Colletotrichum zoysiae TaxID=1216348 RepID=A0AAD9H9S0_9PEZI|nr:MFS general substrate transporter [Colletotrichum zoysiae]
MILPSSQLGQISAMYFAGLSMDRFGYRKTMMFSLGSVMVFLLVPFFATAALVTGGYRAGLGIVVGGSFLLDISPLKLRPALTIFVSMCWIFGQLLSTAAIRIVTTINDNDVLAYRIPVVFSVALARLNPDPAYPLDGQVKALELTDKQEKCDQKDSEITYMECFRGVNLRRTMIVVTTNITQQLCGSSLMFYSAKLYQKAGISSSRSYDFTLMQCAFGIICIVASWPLMKYLGRRTIWLWGLGGAVILMAGVGVLGCFHDTYVAITWAIAILLVVFTGVYNLSIGPLAYAINPEIPSTRQKAKTLVIGRVAYLVAGQFNMWLLPKMLEDAPNRWGLGPRAGMVYSGINVIFLVWAYFCLPEICGRPQVAIDELFKRRISARKFPQVEVETL